MADSWNKTSTAEKSAEAAPDDGDTRDTVRPPFDPADFAKETERITARPEAVGTSDTRELGAPRRPDDTSPAFQASVPRLAMAREDAEWFDVPPAARRVLGEVDGVASLEIICIRAGLPMAECAEAIDLLAREGLVVRD